MPWNNFIMSSLQPVSHCARIIRFQTIAQEAYRSIDWSTDRSMNRGWELELGQMYRSLKRKIGSLNRQANIRRSVACNQASLWSSFLHIVMASRWDNYSEPRKSVCLELPMALRLAVWMPVLPRLIEIFQEPCVSNKVMQGLPQHDPRDGRAARCNEQGYTPKRNTSTTAPMIGTCNFNLDLSWLDSGPWGIENLRDVQ